MYDHESNSYEEFVEKLGLYAARALHPTAPLVTRRSTELEPQHGLVVGAMLDEDPPPIILSSLLNLTMAWQERDLPEVWSVRAPSSVHCRFGVVHRPESATPHAGTLEEFEAIFRRLNRLFISSNFGSPALLRPKLRVSDTEIVLHGIPNEAAYELRRAMLDVLGELRPVGFMEDYGRIVLAEARRTLSEDFHGRHDDHSRTDGWLHETAIGQDEIRLSAGLFSIFTVNNETFSLADDSKRATFTIQ